MSFFKGTFYTCRMSTISGPDPVTDQFSEYIDNKLDCINMGGIWIRDDNNFDDVLQAMLTLFQMAITIGWAK